MNQPAIFGAVTRVVLAGSIVCVFGACSNLKLTLAREPRLFVKVPGLLPPKVGQSRELPVKGEWRFRHVVDALSRDDHEKSHHAQWYQVWHPDKRDRLGWGSTMFSVLRNARARKLTPEVCDAVKRQFGRYPDIVIPELIFSEKTVVRIPAKEKQDMSNVSSKEPSAGGISELVVTAEASKVWPLPGKDEGSLCQTPLWYKGECFSQLDKARGRVAARHGRNGVPEVRVGILDTGFDNKHVALTKSVMEDEGGDAIGFFLGEDNIPKVFPGDTKAGHGTGTIGILSGGKVRFLHKDGTRSQPETLGVLSNATIIPVRIAPWVISASTANMAYGIDYASRERGCDVLSISNGGSPSLIWIDALNAAYERGTAVVAATGDFVTVPGLPFKSWSAPVFPAASRRAIGVAGVSASGKSYGRLDKGLFLKRLANPGNWWSILSGGHTYMRGSYGIDGSRDLLPAQVNSSFLGDLTVKGPPKHVLHRFGRSLLDWQQVARVGELGASPISAYAPNTAWLVPSRYDDKKRNNTVHLDGGGTSSTTPQVAGAVALWFQYHSEGLPRDWQRVQAAHTALTLSAKRSWETVGAKRREDEQSDYFLGAGALKASDALDVTYKQAQKVQGDNLRNQKMPRDFFDGDRSFHRIVLPRFEMALANRNRIDLTERRDIAPLEIDPRDTALARVFFNQELVEHWKRGINPVKCPTIWNWLTLPRITAPQTVVTERGIEARAKAKTKRAMTSAHSVQ